MKKILTILLTIISINLIAQEDIGYRVNYYDTVEFKDVIITQDLDTIILPFNLNDSTVMVINGDTVRVDGGSGSGGGLSYAQIHNYIEADSFDRMKIDTIILDKNSETGSDTVMILCIKQPSGDYHCDTIEISNATTGTFTITDSLLLSDYWFSIDTVYGGDSAVLKIGGALFTIGGTTQAPGDTEAPLANSATVENLNPDSIIVKMSENVQGTEGAGTGGFTVTGHGSPTVTNVNISNDTIGLELSDSLTADSAYLYSYNSGTGDISDGTNDLVSFSDSSVTNNVSDSIELDNLELYWTLDGDATDHSGNGRDGDIFGAYIGDSLDRNDETSKCAYFDGTDDRITFPAGVIDMEQPFSISYWASFNTVSGTQRSMCLADSSFTRPRIQVTMVDDDVSIQTKDEDGNDYNTASYQLADYTWYHVAVVRGTVTETMYIDGTQRAQAVMTGTYTDNNSITLGALPYNNAYLQYTNFKADDLRITSDSLTVSEITELAGE